MNSLSRELTALYRLLRRWFYFTFRRKHVLDMVAGRKGECGCHGCCDLSILARFRHCIDPADRTKCLRWDNLAFGCRMYPFDEKDKIPETRAYCNFYWDKGNAGPGGNYVPDNSANND